MIASYAYNENVSIGYDKNTILRNVKLVSEALNIEITKDEIINKKLLIFLMTIMFCQFQLINLKADDATIIDDEELPAIDPFAGGTAGSTNQSIELDDTQQSSNNGLLNNMRLAGTIIGENNQIAVFSSPDGGAYKFEIGDLLTTSTVLLEIFSDVVIVKDQEEQKFEVYMNNIIRPSEG